VLQEPPDDPQPDDPQPDGSGPAGPDDDPQGPEQGLFVCLPAEELSLAGFAQNSGRAGFSDYAADEILGEFHLTSEASTAQTGIQQEARGRRQVGHRVGGWVSAARKYGIR
jgi:hypothetical protein